MQPLRREVPNGVVTGAALAVLLGLLALGDLIVVRIRKRLWHVVLLTLTDDNRVLVHHQHSQRPPPE